jgi:uncharacterized protein YggE
MVRHLVGIALSLSACSMAFDVSAAGAQTFSPGPTAREPEITVSGHGETHLPPTFAVVMIGVTTRAGTAADAAAQNAAKVASTLAALRQAGVAVDDLTNQGYSIEQAYEDNGRKRGGFTARNTIRARVNGVDQVGKVIDAAVNGGAGEINSVQFGAPNIEEARRAAMTEAVKQARADAAVLASAAGGTLGRLITLSSSSGLPPGYGYAQLESVVLTGAASSVPTVISPRDLTVSAQALGRWEFIPGASR